MLLLFWLGLGGLAVMTLGTALFAWWCRPPGPDEYDKMHPLDRGSGP